MKYDKELYNLIKYNKKARERYFKNRTLAYVMKNKYPSIKDISLDRLQEYVKDILTLDRQWRKILEENPDLRGKDYGLKKVAEQKAQIELGYSQGYYQDVKTLNQIK